MEFKLRDFDQSAKKTSEKFNIVNKADQIDENPFEEMEQNQSLSNRQAQENKVLPVDPIPIPENTNQEVINEAPLELDDDIDGDFDY